MYFICICIYYTNKTHFNCDRNIFFYSQERNPTCIHTATVQGTHSKWASLFIIVGRVHCSRHKPNPHTYKRPSLCVKEKQCISPHHTLLITLSLHPLWSLLLPPSMRASAYYRPPLPKRYTRGAYGLFARSASRRQHRDEQRR